MRVSVIMTLRMIVRMIVRMGMLFVTAHQASLSRDRAREPGITPAAANVINAMI